MRRATECIRQLVVSLLTAQSEFTTEHLQAPGKVPHAARLVHRDGDPRVVQCVGQVPLVTSRGFEDDLRLIVLREQLDQRLKPIVGVGQHAKVLVRVREDDILPRDIDSEVNGSPLEVLPVLLKQALSRGVCETHTCRTQATVRADSLTGPRVPSSVTIPRDLGRGPSDPGTERTPQSRNAPRPGPFLHPG